MCTPVIAISQPLQEPASTWRMWSDRPKIRPAFAFNSLPNCSKAAPVARGSTDGELARHALCEPSSSSEYSAVDLRDSGTEAAKTHWLVILIAGSSSAHKPQKI